MNLFRRFHGYSYWVSLNCCRSQEAKKLSGNPGQCKESGISRDGISNMESLETSCRVIPKTEDQTENILFQWGHQILQTLPRIKSLYDWVRKLIHLLAEEA